jgi:hypothetical protein
MFASARRALTGCAAGCADGLQLLACERHRLTVIEIALCLEASEEGS